jgi:hypothetical protein
LLLYLHWNRYPDTEPFYPLVRFVSMELLSAEEGGCAADGQRAG